MTKHYLDGTASDRALLQWAETRFGDNATRVVFYNVDRDAAIVPSNDHVRSQTILDDGRLVRVDHVSAQKSSGTPRTIFVSVEWSA